MVSYNYLGYGVTNSEGIAKLEYNSEGQKRDHSYTGVGAGEIDVVASLDNPVESGSIVSVPCNVLDAVVIEDELTSAKTWNALLNDDDYYLEFKIHPTSRTACYSYIQIGEDTTNRIMFGHLFSVGISGIMVMNGTTEVTRRTPVTVDLDTDTLFTCKKIGTTYTFTIGNDTEYTVTESSVIDTKLLNLIISNSTFKDFKIYRI